MKKVTTLAIIGLSAIALTACSSGSDSKKDAKASEAKTEQKASSSSEENVSTEFKNARKKAESYEDTVHLSKAKLAEQLVTFEKFTQEEAEYAVKNIKVDFKKQALEKAKDYQKTVTLSEDGLKNQLINFENFTEEEANYAVENLK